MQVYDYEKSFRFLGSPLFIPEARILGQQTTDNWVKSERVPDGEVQGVHILEAGYVEVALFASVVGQVEAKAPVDADHEEVHVVAQAEASAGGQMIEEITWLEFEV